MSPFTALRKFFVPAVAGLPHVDDQFVELDLAKIQADLRLVQRGEERGLDNQPGPDESDLDVVEYEIVNLVGSELNRAQIGARSQAQAYENRLLDLKLLHEIGAIRAETVKAIGDFNSLIIEWGIKLTPKRDAIRESYNDLRLFKAENGLQRPAQEKPPAIVTNTSIALSALAEIVGNAIFLRVNDELGYVGGVAAAILVAAINVGIAYLFGRHVWPQMHSRGRLTRSIAAISIAAWLGFVVVWNLGAAHFRDAKAAGVADPQGAAIQSLVSDPFGLGGIYSWGLLIIGIAAAAVTARSAYSSDDPFPGYGERDRQHNARCEEYADGIAEAIRIMTGVRDDAISGAQEVKEALGQQFRERDRIHNAFSRFRSRYEQYQDRLEVAVNALLATYRDANRRTRSQPQPAHFKERYHFRRSALEPLHDVKVRNEDISDANDALAKCIEELGREFDRAINAFEPLEKLKAEFERGKV